MTQTLPRDVLLKVRKLAVLPEEARQCQFAVPVTHLTILKSLCNQPEVANSFVTYLAGKTLQRVQQGKGRSRIAKDLAHRHLMADALVEMQAWLREQTEERRQRMWELLERMRSEQNEYQRIKWGPVRLIRDADLLLFEYALHCLLGTAHEAGHWAYHTARCYTERYDSNNGTGLIPSSAPLVQDIADFWLGEFGLDSAALTAPAEAKKPRKQKPTARARKGSTSARQKAQFTPRQGQFLAFIHLYRRLHRQGPAELDMVRYFRVTPPSVHAMIVKLEELGLITREPGVARSARVVIPEAEIPLLEEVQGPPW